MCQTPASRHLAGGEVLLWANGAPLVGVTRARALEVLRDRSDAGRVLLMVARGMAAKLKTYHTFK